MEATIPEKRTVQSNQKLDVDTKKLLRIVAAELNRTQNEVLTEAIHHYAALVRSRKPCGHCSQS